MSVRALAERAGIGHVSIVRMEAGDHLPRATAISPMAKALHVSCEYLLTGREPPSVAVLHQAIRSGASREKLLAMIETE